MTLPKLRARLRPVPQSGWQRTDCGRPGCEGWFGIIAKIVPGAAGTIGRGAIFAGARVHLLDRDARLVQPPTGDTPRWVFSRHRHSFRSFRPSRFQRAIGETEEWVRAVEPDAVLECRRCQAVQALPDDANVATLDEDLVTLGGLEVGVSRIRALD